MTCKSREETYLEWALGRLVAYHVGPSLICHFSPDFTHRLSKKLEELGDTAQDAPRYDEAISHYSITLSLNLPFPKDIFAKRIKAFMATGSWREAIDDANQVHHFTPCRSRSFTHHHRVITLDLSSPWGYELKHAALHKAGDYDHAIDAFEEMLSKIAQSPNPDVQRELYPRYLGKDDLFNLSHRARGPVHQPIQHARDDSQNCSMHSPSFATRAHQHDHWSSPR